MSRVPHAEHLDAVVDLDDAGTRAWALVKQSWSILPGGLLPAAVEPLQQDIRDPACTAPLAPGSDFVLGKPGTDVIVQGSAWGVGGRPVHVRDVRVDVGERSKTVRVWGEREVRFVDGRPRPGRPEAFTEVPITWDRAYGGVDCRVPVEGELTVAHLSSLLVDHPGAYPRNPFGTGYLVDGAPADGVRMPSVEDPRHPLTADNLVVGDPRSWWRQPLPAGLDAVSPMALQRMAWLGSPPWHVPPADVVVEEVRRKLLPVDWRALAPVTSSMVVPPRWFHEASEGLAMPWLAAHTPMQVEGMHPEHDVLRFALPPPPVMAIELEGDVVPVVARPTLVRIEPGALRVSVTWLAVRTSLPRVFLKGVHGHIPLVLHVAGAPQVVYDTPVPVRVRLGARC